MQEVEEKEGQNTQKVDYLMVRMQNLPTSNAKNKNDRIVTLIIVWCNIFSILLIVRTNPSY